MDFQEREYKKIIDQTRKNVEWICNSKDPKAKELKKEIDQIISKWIEKHGRLV